LNHSYIGRYCEHVCTRTLGDRRCGFGQCLRIACTKQQRCAFRYEFFSDGTAQPTTAGRNQCHLVLQSEIHCLFLPEVIVSLIQPVLSWWTEDVDVERVG